MTTTTEKIVSEALALDPCTRAYLAERLIESLDSGRAPALLPAWKDEIHRRCREVDENSVELRDASEVFAKAYGSL